MKIWQLMVLINFKLLFMAGGSAEPLPEYFNAILITICQNSLTERTVPYSKVILLCIFDKNTFLYKRKNDFLASSLPLRTLLKGDFGLYSCYINGEQFGFEWTKFMFEVELYELSNSQQKLENFIHGNIIAYKNENTTTFENAFKMKNVVSQTNKFLPSTLKDNRIIFQFECAAYANQMANSTWIFNNTIIKRATTKKLAGSFNDGTLDFNHIYCNTNIRISFTDVGSLICRACKKLDCNSHTINVIVSSEEHVKNFENHTIAHGENAIVKCLVPFKLNLPILWFKLDSAADYEQTLLEIRGKFNIERDFKNISRIELPTEVQHILTTNEHQHQMLLENVQPKDEGWYTCIVFIANTTKITSSFLKVQRRTRSINFKDTLQKYKRFTKIEDFNKENEQNIKLNMLKNELYSHPEETIDAQQQNILSDSERILSVEEGLPKFKKKKPLDDVVRPAGSFVELRCAAIGNPMPNITWTRNNTEVIRRIGTVKYNKWSLKMEDVITDDSGVYKCSACNTYGCIDDTSKVTVIDRLRSPPIQSDKFPQNQTALVNGSATFECRTVSDLEPFIYWVKYTRKNESIRKLEQSVTANTTGDFIGLARNPDQQHLLCLHNITHSDEGWYTCVAGNSIGISVASAYLTVLDKLPNRELQTILRSHPYLIPVVAVFVVSLFILGTLFIIYVLRKLKHEKLLKERIQTVHQWTKKVIIYKPSSSEDGSYDLQMPIVKIEKKRTTFQTMSGNDHSQTFNEYEFPLDSDWEIPRSTLILGSILGEGAFGRVVKAEATNLPSTEHKNITNNNSSKINGKFAGKGRQGLTSSIVAVKMVKEEHTDTDMASLVREMEVMKIIGKHVNIINLLGCCSRSDGPLWVIVEYAPHGNLKDFLKKNRPSNIVQCSSYNIDRSSGYLEEKPFLTDKNLISFAFQVARGMEYLASRRCIHRDLAARNVLVSDDYVMKIADFGLARDLQDTDYYRKNSNGRLPIKWMAPESLQDKFYDSKSDVWSYGVLLWEIMAYGEQPYANLMSADDLYSYLTSGQRMEKPMRCSLNIYLLMRQCWHFDASARPTFSELVEYLEKIFQLTATSPYDEYLDLSIPMLETPPSSSDEEFEPATFVDTSPLRNQLI